jgi:hypothetical protein
MELATLAVVLALTAALAWWMSSYSPARLLVWAVLAVVGIGYMLSLPDNATPSAWAVIGGLGFWVFFPPVAWLLRRARRERGLS